jgi:cell division protein FtsL
MNAVVRALTQPRILGRPASLPQKTGIIWAMAALLLLSALAIVFVKDTYRRSYLSYQTIQQQQVDLTEAHSRLLLESATRLAQSRLALIAKQQGMVVPSDDQIIWLRSGFN